LPITANEQQTVRNDNSGTFLELKGDKKIVFIDHLHYGQHRFPLPTVKEIYKDYGFDLSCSKSPKKWINSFMIFRTYFQKSKNYLSLDAISIIASAGWKQATKDVVEACNELETELKKSFRYQRFIPYSHPRPKSKTSKKDKSSSKKGQATSLARSEEAYFFNTPYTPDTPTSDTPIPDTPIPVPDTPIPVPDTPIPDTPIPDTPDSLPYFIPTYSPYLTPDSIHQTSHIIENPFMPPLEIGPPAMQLPLPPQYSNLSYNTIQEQPFVASTPASLSHSSPLTPSQIFLLDVQGTHENLDEYLQFTDEATIVPEFFENQN